MTGVRLGISVAWLAFWAYWLVSAIGVKRRKRRGFRAPPGLAVILVFFVISRFDRVGGGNVHLLALAILGAVLFACGLGLAVWARVHLGGNWGMPMTEKEEPELVTSGPYSRVRHPIYSGILLGLVGTALAVNYYFFAAVVIVAAYFVYSATVEERNLTTTFPAAYPGYRKRTKMLIPFVL